MPNTMKQEREQVEYYLLSLQQTICVALEQEDGQGQFEQDQWVSHTQGGGGRTRVFKQGQLFEQAGVNFSSVMGEQLPAAATKKRPNLVGHRFHAMGVSSVIHPINPFVPTTHLNVRFFLAENERGEATWWFGGGYDLTPYYGFEADCIHWHKTAKSACDPFGIELYPKFKQWADDYFYIAHRDEQRGIGGIFFDDFNELSFEQSFTFLQSIGDSFLTAYLPIVQARKQMAYEQAHIDFQHYRRGRYVEFNLVYDRGTLFGLQSKGRTESILMSLPPKVSWRYNWQPRPNTEEAKLYQQFLPRRDWLKV